MGIIRKILEWIYRTLLRQLAISDISKEQAHLITIHKELRVNKASVCMGLCPLGAALVATANDASKCQCECHGRILYISLIEADSRLLAKFTTMDENLYNQWKHMHLRLY